MNPTANQRGSVYIIVLATTSVAMITVSAGLLVTRIHASRAAAQADAAAAARLARSGVETALISATQDIVWRTAITADNTIKNIQIGSTKLKVTASDPLDGNIKNGLDNPVRFRAEAILNAARRVYSVTASPNTTPSPLYNYGIVAGGNITISGTSLIWSKQTIHSNGSITASSGYVEAPVTATGSATGSALIGTTSSGVAAVTLPTFATLRQEYAAIGSSGVMGGSGATTFEKAVIGPTAAPWALSANASAVYIVDCNNRRLTLTKCRVNATMIFLNASAGVRVTDGVMWDPKVAGYPALIVDGPLSITSDGTDLLESDAGVNMNPVGMPFEGSADSDTADRYATEIRGLVYCTGNLTMSGANTVYGPIVVGGTVTTTSLAGTYVGVTPQAGPPGLRAASPQFIVDLSTWTRDFN